MDFLERQAEQDTQFEDRLMTFMHKEAEADRRMVATAFDNNLQILKTFLDVMHDMSGTMMAYYTERFCGCARDKHAAAVPIRVVH